MAVNPQPFEGDSDYLLLAKLALNVYNLSPAINPGVPAISTSPVREFYLDVLRGKITGMETASIVGRNPDVDALPEDVWIAGGIYIFPATAQSIEMVSDSASDTALGIGARTVVISGLDGSYNPLTRTVSLNGITPVAVTGSWLRINDLVVATVGSSESNVGNVRARIAGGGNTLSLCAPAAGRAQQAIYTVRAGVTAFPTFSAVGSYRTAGAAELIEFEYRSRTFGAGWIIRSTVPVSMQGGVWQEVSPVMPIPFVEKTDIVFRATGATANNFIALAQAQFLLIENSLA